MRPIGHWLNRVDKAIADHWNGALAEHGLTRVAWRVLNSARNGATDAGIVSAMAADTDAADIPATIATLLADGWFTRPAPGRLALTDDGRARLARVSERVDASRALSMTGITDDEYRTAVSVLERMARNLEAVR